MTDELDEHAEAIIVTLEYMAENTPEILSLQEPELRAALAALKARPRGDSDLIRDAVARVERAVVCQICRD